MLAILTKVVTSEYANKNFQKKLQYVFINYLLLPKNQYVKTKIDTKI